MKKIILFSIVALGIISCNKLLGPDKGSVDPQENFDYLWNEVDKKYSYFELKGIDWDQIRDKYKVKIKPGMTEEALFDVLGNMLDELRDDHTNLISPFNISRYNVAGKHKANFRFRTIQDIMPNMRMTEAFLHDTIPGENIAYIRYESFMSGFSEKALDNILTRYKDTKGIILDLRENGGGNMANIALILERFTAQRTLVGYFKTRNGKGRNDFSSPVNFYLNKHDGVTYNKPVMVLTDRGSFSATTMFSLATKALPNVTLVGDTTGGGGGAPNGGQLPNGWTYRFSVSQLLDLNMDNYAEKGVPPDIYSEFDWNDVSQDPILNRAILELN